MNSRDLNATYDAWSDTYDETLNPLIPVEEITVHSLLRSIEFHDVLDAGTGTGRYAIYLAEQGKRVSAIDCNGKMLKEARRKAAAQDLSIDFRLDDIRGLSFENETFDLAICALTLAHIESLTEPCSELMRVLRQNGHLIISDLHPFVQEEFGPEFETGIVEGEGLFYFPNYHTEVSSYLGAVESSGGEIVTALDVPLQNKGEVFPGGLIIWARKL